MVTHMNSTDARAPRRGEGGRRRDCRGWRSGRNLGAEPWSARLFLPLQPCDQARRVPALAAHLLHFRIELIDQRRHRQVARRSCAPRRGRSTGPCASSRPRSRNRTCRRSWSCSGSPSARTAPRPWRWSAITLLDVEAGLLGEMDAFGEPLHQPGDADLVDHLGRAGRRPARPSACTCGHRRR